MKTLSSTVLCIVLPLVSCKTRDFGWVASAEKDFVNPLAFNA